VNSWYVAPRPTTGLKISAIFGLLKKNHPTHLCAGTTRKAQTSGRCQQNAKPSLHGIALLFEWYGRGSVQRLYGEE
jgi:hypothetical protein